ncbi:MAG: sarcosine oxidase subunit alpha family protein [Stappia sp.]|uniref:sarcosine oxidase subunit alpha family protein n=1 Tax=Stappia sp. TaxID=1870903 RepID=UPI000C53983E|nr:sarcosine oxidase subunit alpha family protein [Stappia sp.]MAA98611.1 sarcosine oxidase subunit alpha family protein [Stappia sp.]MBM20560.1 sarcosine oxidase subunit alpha family protein [Stappia sp.]
MSGFRLKTGGAHVTRESILTFRFDGKTLEGYEGDTLASALIASGRKLVGRSFKYHRPRGVFSAGVEEPNALVELRTGSRQEPNTRATMAELYEGLDAASQNRWPSLRHDMMAVNDYVSPLLTAGFYYKTFMEAGQSGWHVAEKFIRRAAGLGRGTHFPDPDRYDKQNAFCDLLVVGAGPAGMMAALAAARAGLKVILADENVHPGGRVFEESGRIDGLEPAVWASRTAAMLEAEGVRLMARTSVYGYFDGNVLGAVERVGDHLREPPVFTPRQRHWTIHAGHVVLATGAIERPLVFSGNDAPGVMLASAGLAYARRFGVAVGRSVIVFSNNDGGARTALSLHELGVPVKAVVDCRRAIDAGMAEELAERGIRVETGAVVAATRGRKALASVEIRGFDPDTGRLGDNGMHPACDTLLVAGGWTPSVHLASQAGSAPVFDEGLHSFVPGTPREAWTACGACSGRLDLAACLESGRDAGLAAAAALGKAMAGPVFGLPELSGVAAAELPAPVFEVPACGRGKRFVDLQHDVTADDIALANREGFSSVEHVKRYTTLGMAADQGKTSNVNAIALLARERGLASAGVGTTRFRMPWTPVTIGALAGRETGGHLAPVRRTPLHDWHVEQGAEMMAAGRWMRPRAYIRAGETLEQAYVREARAVRASVGLVDVSTLGKIDVQGPDAAAFLDRLYANPMGKLAVGKARYGVMLREDGILFDDGTAWRLSVSRFLVTTTTANAAAVLAHMEHCLEILWPELHVNVTSVTDRYAALAIAGPASRAVLASALGEGDVSDAACPHMGIVRGRIGATPVMIARLSFSGELAYEVYSDWNDGPAVWEALLAAGANDSITPYGMEALGTLRIEKGHITGAEMDGRTTLADLGLGRMASRRKPYIGSAMLDREALAAPGRRVLVGLVSQDGNPIRTGSHLTLPGEAASLGHVTAMTFSPVVGTHIALALLAGGRERVGDTLEAVFPMKDETVRVKVTEPCFHDPEGNLLNV